MDPRKSSSSSIRKELKLTSLDDIGLTLDETKPTPSEPLIPNPKPSFVYEYELSQYVHETNKKIEKENLSSHESDKLKYCIYMSFYNRVSNKETGFSMDEIEEMYQEGKKNYEAQKSSPLPAEAPKIVSRGSK